MSDSYLDATPHDFPFFAVGFSPPEAKSQRQKKGMDFACSVM